MQTNFSLAQLADPQTARSEQVLRACVHCGFCTATCPTYVLLGDELDSPRGRIYLIKDMLENDRPATAEVAKHIDRCLSCLSCMTTCPSGVHYMHLIDHARDHVEATYDRPLMDRLLRAMLARVLPSRALFRLAIGGAMVARPFAGLFDAVPGLKPVAAMLRLAPARPATRSASESERRFPAQGPRRARVALLDGCAQPVLRPEIDEAAIRLLTRMGVEIVRPVGGGCCGSLTHHMGKEDLALANARANVDAWWREMEGEGLDAIIVTTSGCGTTIKDYGHMLRTDPAYAERAAKVSALAKDVSEFLAERELPAPVIAPGPPRRLSRRLLAPARPEGARGAQGAAGESGLHRAGAGGRAPVLRLGRHLQHIAAGDRRAPARAQGRQYRAHPAAGRRHRQYRLHDADRRWHLDPRAAYRSNCWTGRRAGPGRGCSTACASPPDRSAAARL